MNEKWLLMCICIISLLICSIIAASNSDIIRQTQIESAENLILIDPGHGGMDGGAVNSDGTSEKNINLEIAGKLADMAEAHGWQVVMTRDSDRWLCETEEGSIRSRKTEDLKQRCQMIEQYKPQVAVSIHLNSFKEDPSVKGVQVFYPETKDGLSKKLAEIIQSELNRELNVEKERTAMVRDGVMIFRNASCPIVIVECGFLSNAEDTRLLQDDEYQERMAAGILAGINRFTGHEKPETVEIIDSSR